MTHQEAINLAHDERRPFCFRGEWFVIPYYFARLSISKTKTREQGDLKR